MLILPPVFTHRHTSVVYGTDTRLNHMYPLFSVPIFLKAISIFVSHVLVSLNPAYSCIIVCFLCISIFCINVSISVCFCITVSAFAYFLSYCLYFYFLYYFLYIFFCMSDSTSAYWLYYCLSACLFSVWLYLQLLILTIIFSIFVDFLHYCLYLYICLFCMIVSMSVYFLYYCLHACLFSE